MALHCFSLQTVSGVSQFALVREGADLPEIVWEESFPSRERRVSVAVDSVLEEVLRRLPSSAPVCAVVCPGPGSFTGIRMGVGSAQAFCRAKGATLYSVSLVDALLYSGKSFENSVLCMDGKNGFLLWAPIQRGANITVTPYGETNALSWMKTKTTVYCTGEDQTRLWALGGTANKFSFEDLGVLPVARWMAEKILRLSSQERSQYVFRQPEYALPAFTSKPRA